MTDELRPPPEFDRAPLHWLRSRIGTPFVIEWHSWGRWYGVGIDAPFRSASPSALIVEGWTYWKPCLPTAIVPDESTVERMCAAARTRIEALEGALRQAADHLALASDDFLDASERHGRATAVHAHKRRSSICAAAAKEARAAAKEAMGETT